MLPATLVENIGMLVHVDDLSAQGCWIRCKPDRFTCEMHALRIGRRQAGQHAKQRAFAGAVHAGQYIGAGSIELEFP